MILFYLINLDLCPILLFARNWRTIGVELLGITIKIVIWTLDKSIVKTLARSKPNLPEKMSRSPAGLGLGAKRRASGAREKKILPLEQNYSGFRRQVWFAIKIPE